MGAARTGDQKENSGVASHATVAALPPKRAGRAVLAQLAPNTLLCNSADTPRGAVKLAAMAKPELGRTPLARGAPAPSAAQVISHTSRHRLVHVKACLVVHS